MSHMSERDILIRREVPDNQGPLVGCSRCGGDFPQPKGNPLFTDGFSHCEDHWPAVEGAEKRDEGQQARLSATPSPLRDALRDLVDDSYVMVDQLVSPQFQKPHFRCIHCEATKFEGELVSPHAKGCPVGLGEVALWHDKINRGRREEAPTHEQASEI